MTKNEQLRAAIQQVWPMERRMYLLGLVDEVLEECEKNSPKFWIVSYVDERMAHGVLFYNEADANRYKDMLNKDVKEGFQRLNNIKITKVMV